MSTDTKLPNTDQHTKMLHDTEIGQRVKVEREEATGDFVNDAAEALKSIGRAFGAHDPTAKVLKYVGSAAVHIYISEQLTDEKGKHRAGYFTQVSTLGPCNEMIASDAVTQIAKDAMAKHYGRSMPKKRSGF